ncbi:MAG: phospho-sugar mutase [Bacteroidales bacterium]|jgi:phosphoglucomutase|nr:phospho-sugar mutase [Bacteroidales bacterium]
MNKVDAAVLERAQKWLGTSFDEDTRNQVKTLMDNDPIGLTDAFYRDLEFGTGGLRGIMGVGTNRMNKYTVGMATQGLANYLKQCFPDVPQIRVAIAYDCRNNSPYFAEISAEILSANGMKVFLFKGLRPTPELSFAVREKGCQSGIVITASHNPKEYNGYKVYWDDGGQLVAPHDKNVIREVKKITSVDQVRFERVEENIEMLDEAMDKLYLERMKAYSLAPENNLKHRDLKIVFTPIHGTAVKLAPAALKAFGFEQVFPVPEQDVTSGDFPTVHSPNPEEPAALKMALDKAREVDAELVMATDPDADRVGIAVKDLMGEYVLLNGNQTASLLISYILKQWKANGKLTGKEYIVKTIVTSELLKKIAEKQGVECFDVLTGFKYIAEIIRNLEGKKTFIAGGEESYGYLVGDYVRDKDAIISCCFVAEAAAWARQQGKTLYETLVDLYVEYGFYLEKLISITKKGKAGLEEIQAMMEGFRNNPPLEIDGMKVAALKDFQTSVSHDFLNRREQPIDLPKSNVLQFFLEDGSKITMRPSGTEPKIKFYFGAKGKLESAGDFEQVNAQLEEKIKGMIASLKLE